jgi:hypothetical protein
MSRIIAPLRIFDLDDFSAEIGQRLRAGRAGHHAGEINDQQTVEGGRNTLLSCRPVR